MTRATQLPLSSFSFFFTIFVCPSNNIYCSEGQSQFYRAGISESENIHAYTTQNKESSNLKTT